MRPKSHCELASTKTAALFTWSKFLINSNSVFNLLQINRFPPLMTTAYIGICSTHVKRLWIQFIFCDSFVFSSQILLLLIERVFRKKCDIKSTNAVNWNRKIQTKKARNLKNSFLLLLFVLVLFTNGRMTRNFFPNEVQQHSFKLWIMPIEDGQKYVSISKKTHTFLQNLYVLISSTYLANQNNEKMEILTELCIA